MKSIFLITLLSTLLCHANESSLGVRTLALEGVDMPEWFVAVDNSQFEQLKWPTRQPSAAIKVQAKGELAIYAREMDQDGKAEFKIIRKVTIPEVADEVLLLSRNHDDNDQPDLIAIPDDHKKAKFNDWLVINQSDQDVTFRYGQDIEPLKLSPGETKPYQIQGERDKGGEVVAEAMIKGEMKKIYSTFWSASDKQRSVILFYNKGDAVKVLRMADFLNEDKESNP